MECQVSWSSPRRELCKRLFGRTKLSCCTIEPVDHHLIDTEIRGERVAFSAIENHAMRVWSFLLFLRARSFALFYFDRHSDRAVSANGQYSHTAARIVCDQQCFFPRIDAEVTRIGALRGLFIQEAGVSGSRIDLKRAHGATRFSGVLTN